MIIGSKDIVKLFSISIVTCCAVFVCTLFLNYNIDLAAITGGCLGIISVILLIFYVKNYIDTHGRELGILKETGYSNLSVARYFWVFGLSVFAGCAVGFCAAYAYLSSFYEVQNADRLLPDISVQFHFVLFLYVVIFPSLACCAFYIMYAFLKLKRPTLDLMYERKQAKIKSAKDSSKELSFLQCLKRATLKSKKYSYSL